MNGFSVLMFILSIGVFLSGLYLFTGHNSELLLWKTYRKNTPKEEIINVGKWTMISSLVPLVLGILGIIFKFE